MIEASLRSPRVVAVNEPCLIHRHHGRGRMQFQPGLTAATTYWQEARLYRKACQLLEAQAALTPRRRKAIASNLFPLAQRTAIFSLSEATEILAWARELDPDFRIPVRRRIDNLYRWLNFATAQTIVNLARAARNTIRKLRGRDAAYVPSYPTTSAKKA